MSEPKRMKLHNLNEDRLLPILPDELTEETPLIEVYVDEILDPRNTSKVIVELNSCFPISQLNHLKRVKGKFVLLFPITECEESKVHLHLSTKGFDVKYLSESVHIVAVAQIPPKVRKQYMVVNKLWPCNFHSDKYLEKLSTNTLFSESEIVKHEGYMRVAIEVSKCASETNSNGVVIVDPKIDSIVAVGYDNLTAGPCQHSVMVAIDNVARTQGGGAWQTPSINRVERNANLDTPEDSTNGIPAKMLHVLQKQFPGLRFGANRYKSKSELQSPSDGPYLCTGYYAYSLQEPCVMCAMALVHSRINRTFYGLRSQKGGLGTLCKVHTVKDLNHHFESFENVLRTECALQMSLV